MKTIQEKIERMDLTMARRPKGNYEAYICILELTRHISKVGETLAKAIRDFNIWYGEAKQILQWVQNCGTFELI